MDRTLVRWAYGDGKTITELAVVHRVSPRAMSRRLSRLVERCESVEFKFVIARIGAWEGPMKAVAQACVIEGRSVRAAAAHLNMSIHTVRALRTAVLAMASGAQQVGDLAERWRAA
jgi:DNA-directed RNA polymerase specialized sigma24 family protein